MRASDGRDRPGRRTRDAFDGDATGTGLAIALVMLAFELVRFAMRSLLRLAGRVTVECSERAGKTWDRTGCGSCSRSC